MIKLANTTEDVYVKMKKSEFKVIAQAGAATFADGAEIDIAWLDKILSNANTPTQMLADTKAQLINTLQMIDSLQKASLTQ